MHDLFDKHFEAKGQFASCDTLLAIATRRRARTDLCRYQIHLTIRGALKKKIQDYLGFFLKLRDPPPLL